MTTPLVDYQYYTGTYLGNAIAVDDFPRLYLRAFRIVDQFCFGRATQIQLLIPAGATTWPAPTQVTEVTNQNEAIITAVEDQTYHTADVDAIKALKDAICAVAEEYQRLDRVSGNQEIASERVGDNSVSYIQNATANLSDMAKLKKAAKLYLIPTGLMYSGVYEWKNDDLYRYWGWWWI